MPSAYPLAELLLSGGARAGTPSSAAALEPVLSGLWMAGKRGWQEIDVPQGVFVRWLVPHLPAEGDLLPFLAAIHAADLYLCCGASLRLPEALSAFDQVLLAQLRVVLAKARVTPDLAEELPQLLRQHLLVGLDGSARISRYAGTGPLRIWLRVVAARELQRQRRRRGQQGEEIDLATAGLAAMDADPELGYLRARYRPQVEEALRAAFMSLSWEERHVLRLHYAGGLPGDRIAALLGRSRATVVRWLASARSSMYLETRRSLQERLRLPPAELDSLIRLIRSCLDLDLARLLATADHERG